MNNVKHHIDGTLRVRATLLNTSGTGDTAVEEDCAVAMEGPLTIDIGNLDAFTIMCTPTNRRAMTIGFLYSEGLIDSIDDIEVLNECEDSTDVVRVRFATDRPPKEGQGRNLLIVSSCGLCGSESMDEKLAAMATVGDSLRLSSTTLRSVQRDMREGQRLFEECGGTHAAGLFDAKGAIVSSAEDIGRHNALDKAIGKCLIEGRTTAGLGAALSGRVSLEMVGKCARAGIELIAAVSAPTSIALDAAERCQITLCAFVRDTRATVFSHPHRLE